MAGNLREYKKDRKHEGGQRNIQGPRKGNEEKGMKDTFEPLPGFWVYLSTASSILP